mgnify:CR=1 FL=1
MSILLVRGLPGSGKTTFTELISLPTMSGIRVPPVSCSADDFFYEGEEYNFDPKLLPDAHGACLNKAREAVLSGDSVMVHNTFTQRWEMQPYIDLAEEAEVALIVISTYDGGCDDETLASRNTHGVPVESIAAMRGRWEEDWKNGDPLPPWER